MFFSKERQEKIKEAGKEKAVAETRGDAEGVTLGFNTSEQPSTEIEPEIPKPDKKSPAQEILFRKFTEAKQPTHSEVLNNS